MYSPVKYFRDHFFETLRSFFLNINIKALELIDAIFSISHNQVHPFLQLCHLKYVMH